MVPSITVLALALAAAGCQDPAPRAAFAYASEPSDESEATLRRVWADSRDYATPSPDGQLIAYVDWGTGDVAVHDVATGADRRVTDKGSWEANGSWAEEPLFSPDGRRIVYTYGNVLTGSPFRYELRMVELGDTTQHLLLALETEDEWIAPMAWHASAGIVVELNRASGETLLAALSPEDGALTVIRRFGRDERHPHAAAISPDGRLVVYAQDQALRAVALDGSEDRSLEVADALLLGFAPDGESVLFHAERAGTRGIWSLRLEDGRPAGEPVLVRDGIPHLIPGGFSNKGYFYAVPVEGPKIYMAAVDVDRGGLLMQPRQITSAEDGWARMPTWSPDGRSFAYVLRSHPNEPAQIVISSADGGHERPVAEVRQSNIESLSWSRDGESLYYIASGGKWPALFRLDLATGATSKAAEPVGRVAELSRDGRSVALSRDGIYLRDLESARELRLAEARGDSDIAVSPDGSTVVFSRRAGDGSTLLAVPTAGGQERVLLRLPEGEHIEGLGHTLAYTPDGERLLALLGDGEGRHRIVSLPSSGGEAVTLIDLPQRPDGPEKAHARLHPDGRRIIYSTGYPRSELWLMEF